MSISIPFSFAFISNIADLSSKSGGWISTVKPPKNLEWRRSSRFLIALGGRSEVKIIWPPAEAIALKV